MGESRALLGRGWPFLLPAPIALIGVYRVILALLRPSPDSDFGQYYLISRVGLRHGFARIYDLGAQRQEWISLGMTSWFPNPDTPALAWFTAPLALLPYGVASALWTALIVACVGLAWWLCAPVASRGRHLWLAAAFFPVLFALRLGQVVPIVLAAVAVAYWLLRRDRDRLAGLVLLLLALKPQLAILVPPALLLAGRRRAFLTFGAGAALIGVAAAAGLGAGGVALYLHRLLGAVSQPGAGKELLVATDLTLRALVPAPGAWVAQAGLAAAALVAARAWRSRGVEVPLAAGIVGSLLLTPFIHVQDLSMLLVAGWLTLRAEPRLAPICAAGYAAASLAAGTGLVALAAELVWLGAILLRRPGSSRARPAEPPAALAPAPSTATPAG